MRGVIKLLRCGRPLLSSRCTDASPLPFIFSFSPSLTPKSKAQEKLVTRAAWWRSVFVWRVLPFKCVFERNGVQEKKKGEQQENKIVFHPKAYNSALYLKIDVVLKKSLLWPEKGQRSKHQKRAAVGNSLPVLHIYSRCHKRRVRKEKQTLNSTNDYTDG